MDDTTIAAIAKALAHPARLHILRLLAAQTECRGADVFAELPLAQSTISEHLRVLRDANLIHSRPLAGSNGTVYCLAPGVFEDFIAAMSGIASAAPLCNTSGGC